MNVFKGYTGLIGHNIGTKTHLALQQIINKRSVVEKLDIFTYRSLTINKVYLGNRFINDKTTY